MPRTPIISNNPMSTMTSSHCCHHDDWQYRYIYIALKIILTYFFEVFLLSLHWLSCWANVDGNSDNNHDTSESRERQMAKAEDGGREGCSVLPPRPQQVVVLSVERWWQADGGASGMLLTQRSAYKRRTLALSLLQEGTAERVSDRRSVVLFRKWTGYQLQSA